MMETLQTLLDNSTTPALTALLLGLLTAVSPCPLATNIAAIGFIGKDIEKRRRIFINGVLYTVGRTIAYTALGVILIAILREGESGREMGRNPSGSHACCHRNIHAFRA